MEAKHIEILSFKYGKVSVLEYYHKVEGRNYSVDEEEGPHPDLKKALVKLHTFLAAAYYVIGEERENFRPTGFTITKGGDKETIDQVKIHGKVKTSYGKTHAIHSDDIPVTTKGLEDVMEDLKTEAFAYFFLEKTAVTQGAIPGMETKKDAAARAADEESGDAGNPPAGEK